MLTTLFLLHCGREMTVILTSPASQHEVFWAHRGLSVTMAVRPHLSARSIVLSPVLLSPITVFSISGLSEGKHVTFPLIHVPPVANNCHGSPFHRAIVHT